MKNVEKYKGSYILLPTRKLNQNMFNWAEQTLQKKLQRIVSKIHNWRQRIICAGYKEITVMNFFYTTVNTILMKPKNTSRSQKFQTAALTESKISSIQFYKFQFHLSRTKIRSDTVLVFNKVFLFGIISVFFSPLQTCSSEQIQTCQTHSHMSVIVIVQQLRFHIKNQQYYRQNKLHSYNIRLILI